MGVMEQSPDSSELLVEVESIFNRNLLTPHIGLLEDSNNHLMGILSKHREDTRAQRGVWIDTVCKLGTGKAKTKQKRV